MAPIEPRPSPSSPPTAGAKQTPAAPSPRPGADSFSSTPTGRQDRWMQGSGDAGKSPHAMHPSTPAPGTAQVPPRSTGPILFGPVETSALVASASTRSARWASAAATVVQVARLPGTAYLTFRDVRETFRNKAQAVAPSSVGVSSFRAAASLARTVLTEATPRAARGATPRVVSTLAAQVLKSGSPGVQRDGDAPSTRLGVDAARVAVSKAAGRFAPGFDVTLALPCTTAAAGTLGEPGVAMSKKVTAGVSSVGSIAAATHIPVVSQAGAVVSMASGFVGTFL
ncbi:hypothetical protein [Myxococcus landrumensis]|uniref:Uncharacterized protein n=1 Tax=Myxococcus landrumensis TaxID=2813577 RepID=A0ABX7N078_9BACT|nr:hypothetical protein [Myxococcus landrumus]QSQ10801.1 hypothetical protein JY572_20415 [Myxococcus landrumus]